MVHWLPQSQKAVFTTPGHSPLTMAHSLGPHSELDEETLAFVGRLLCVFADAVNSATASAPFVCIPIGTTGLTSEMRVPDLTGFLKGSSCRN